MKALSHKRLKRPLKLKIIMLAYTINQYLPKKTDFTQISKEEIITIQDKLNHRPRKILNYKTPYEVFFKELAKQLAA